MTISFTDKHVLITGGSEGIGFALAKQFLSDGAVVTLLARNLEKLKKAQNVGVATELTVALRRVEDDYGAVDVAVCNAGLAIPKLMVDQQLEEVERVMQVSLGRTVQVNYLGCYYTAHALLPGMLSRGEGHLCFISSMAYVNPMAGFTGYGPSKAAVRHLADCMRSELNGSGVTVSVGYPPDTQTPGLDHENETKSGVVYALLESEKEVVHSPETVAACLFKGLQRRAYHLPTPVLFHRLGLSLVAGITPRPLWILLEMIIAPILVLVSFISQRQQDAVVRKWRAGIPPRCPFQSTQCVGGERFQAPGDAAAEAAAVRRGVAVQEEAPALAQDPSPKTD